MPPLELLNYLTYHLTMSTPIDSPAPVRSRVLNNGVDLGRLTCSCLYSGDLNPYTKSKLSSCMGELLKEYMIETASQNNCRRLSDMQLISRVYMVFIYAVIKIDFFFPSDCPIFCFKKKYYFNFFYYNSFIFYYKI